MGLDITYYSEAEPVHLCEKWTEALEDQFPDCVFLWINPAFPDACNLQPGFYHATREGSFRAGSYGGYNHWRNTLSRAVLGAPQQTVWNMRHMSRPFVELINFSDCEGVIAGPAAEKLARDFVEHRATFANRVDGGRLKVYDDFAEAFRVASERNGFVDFH